MKDKELSDFELLDSISDHFEANWSQESLSLIESCLNRCPANLKESLFAELLRIDIELRADDGSLLRPEAYMARFPGYASSINQATQNGELAAETELIGVAKTKRADDDKVGETTVLSPFGRKFGRFLLKQELGRGAFGRVFRAHDPTLDREVALKLPQFETDDQLLTERFLSEAQIAAQLQHPHIVAVWERGLVDKQFYLSSSYVRGITLQESLAESSPDFAQIVDWIGKLAAALDYAHRKNVIHRDIKPANIMIDEQSQPMIMDFGLAKRTDHAVDLTRDGAIMGTPAYMSPEQARGITSEIGPQTDQYSLGIVFWELLTGNPPWKGGVHELLAVLQANPDPPLLRNGERNVPIDLLAICQKMLQPAVGDRYPTCGEVAADLNRYLEGHAVSVRRISAAERFMKWCSRNQIVSTLVLLISFTILASLIAVSAALFEARSQAEYAEQQSQLAQQKGSQAVQQAIIAQRQKNNAVTERTKAEKLAVKSRQEASRSQLLLAGFDIQKGRFFEATNRLNGIPNEDRNWVWKVQASRIPKEIHRIPLAKLYSSRFARVAFDKAKLHYAISGAKNTHHTTWLYDAKTGKRVHEIAPEYDYVIPLHNGFTLDSRYLVLKLLKYPMSPRGFRVGVFDVETKEMIASKEEIVEAIPSPYRADQVFIKQRVYTDDGKKVRGYAYSRWNFLEDKTDARVESSPWVTMEGFCYSEDGKEISLRNGHYVAFRSVPQGKQLERSLEERLGATHLNLSANRKQIVGVLREPWAWRTHDLTIPSGRPVVVEFPSTMSCALEPHAHVADCITRDSTVANAAHKPQGYFMAGNQNVVLNLVSKTNIYAETSPLCWWNRNTGEYLGRAMGVSVSQNGDRFAAIQDGNVVIRHAPLHVRRFQSQHVERELNRWSPVYQSYKTACRPAIFYWKNTPWVVSSHSEGANLVNGETHVVSIKSSPEKRTIVQQPDDVFISPESGVVAIFNSFRYLDIISMKTMKYLKRVGVDKPLSETPLCLDHEGDSLLLVGDNGFKVFSLTDEAISEQIPIAKKATAIAIPDRFRRDEIIFFQCMAGEGLVDMNNGQIVWLPDGISQNTKYLRGSRSLSHNGSLFALGGAAGAIGVFNAETGEMVQEIFADAKNLTAEFHPTEPLLLIGREDGRLMVYDTATWKVVFDEQVVGGRFVGFIWSQDHNAVTIKIRTTRGRRWFEFAARTKGN